jgi:hypothetical protein
VGGKWTSSLKEARFVQTINDEKEEDETCKDGQGVDPPRNPFELDPELEIWIARRESHGLIIPRILPDFI